MKRIKIINNKKYIRVFTMCAKTQNLSVLNDLNKQLNNMYNTEEYQIKTVFRHEKN